MTNYKIDRQKLEELKDHMIPVFKRELGDEGYYELIGERVGIIHGIKESMEAEWDRQFPDDKDAKNDKDFREAILDVLLEETEDMNKSDRNYLVVITDLALDTILNDN